MLPVMEEDVIVTVLDWTKTPPPEPAVLPVMVHDEMVTVPPKTATPPPFLLVAVLE